MKSGKLGFIELSKFFPHKKLPVWEVQYIGAFKN
jgi:hypothetical protein